MKSATCPRARRSRTKLGDATYRVVVEYDGTDFSGFQFQPELRTVAGELESALARLFAQPVKVTVAGRTDAGVHASAQVISFVSHDAFPIDKLSIALNTSLPADLSARDALRVEPGFSARNSALERCYTYAVVNRRDPSAMLRRFAHHEYRALDFARMRAAAAHLIGEHDFVTFCGYLPDRGGTVRTLHAIEIESEGDLVRFHLRGGGFLHRMVRIIVGTLLEVGAGRREPEEVAAMLAARDRRMAGPTAPAAGLVLADVVYPGFRSGAPGFAWPPGARAGINRRSG
jgi:tRNA pseudouridine38-40 synthase